MLKNKPLKKLIGIKKEDFDNFVKTKQIQVQPARLIPTLKTGDEMALTSILLSTIRLVKEFRDNIFKEIKLTRNGKIYYYTEAHFPDIEKSRIDGLIIVVVKGIIKDAVFFEMKNKNNKIDESQINTYIGISKTLGVDKLVTVSNEFVSDSTLSPLKIKTPKNFNLFHFSWTYLITKGQLLLFINDENIEDEDQVEIMKETLHYFENPVSGISGYTKMKKGWKEVVESVKARKPLKISDEIVIEAIESWHEEEKDIALLLSRKLGVYVKSTKKNKESISTDAKKLVKDTIVVGNLDVKDAVSPINIKCDFETKTVSMSVKLTPPMDKGNKARITWLVKQLENCKKKNEEDFTKMQNDIWIEANLKHARVDEVIKLKNLLELNDRIDNREIQSFKVTFNNGFGASFGSATKFIVNIEQMTLDYYGTLVQYLSNWNKPTPKITED